MKICTALFGAALTTCIAGLSFAQADLPFGGFSHDNSQPVEIAADSLTVNQAEGRVLFDGNVAVGQGTLRLQANRIVVTYIGEGVTGQVDRMEATGDVVLTNGAEAAEAQNAVYEVASGSVVMTGDVLLTQGENALSGERLRIDLTTGTAQMEGRVRTILQPASGQ